ncbi:zinc metalloprotease HtpX [Natronospora cellulosivora (SeqCode)]
MHGFKTFILMTLLTVILVVLGGAIAGEQGLVMALIFSFAINFFSYWYSDKIAIKMTRSRPLKESEAPHVYEMLRRLTQRARMPMPDLYLTPSGQPNAFATGRNPKNAAVAVTEGIMNLLSDEELEGVIAHELAHIKNRDTLISTIAATMAGVLTFVARMGRYRMMFGGARRRSSNNGGGAAALLSLIAVILAPIAAMVIRFAISRSREYVADETGARIAGRSDGLANALLKMQRQVSARPMQVNEATSHMFILNPLSAKGMGKLFSTHPPIEERVARLQKVRF